MDLNKFLGLGIALSLLVGQPAAGNPGDEGARDDSTKPYIFVVPPRETLAEATRIYGPVAEYLTSTLGHKVEFQYQNNWLSYQSLLWSDSADIYFDGPHFVAWRMHKNAHVLGPRLPQNQDWRLFTRADHPKVLTLANAAGRRFCAHAPPNFGTLYALSLLDNPARQPYITNTKGWPAVIDGVMNGKCDFGIVPLTQLKTFDPSQTKTRVLNEGPHFPNQAFTYGPRFSAEQKARMTAALLSPEGQKALENLRKEFANGRDLVAGKDEDYQGVDGPLMAYWEPIYGAIIAQHATRNVAKQ